MTTDAFLFPGQGSQSLGMLAELAATTQVVEATFAEASEALDRDLWALCQHGPEDELNQTRWTQPAMLAADIATWRAWREAGGATPGYMAGHSLGEYAALVAGGAMEFGDAIGLVAERGRLMQAAVPAGEGAMAAILGLEDTQLDALCRDQAAGQVVSCANFNSPGQVVIAGHREAVERVCEAAKASGARRALPLPVSVPSHCELMRPAAEALAGSLAGVSLQAPAVPVIQNADVESFGTPEEIRAALARQLYSPVQWTRTVEALLAHGVTRFLECGPGKVLSGLNRRISRDSVTHAIGEPDALRAAVEESSS